MNPEKSITGSKTILSSITVSNIDDKSAYQNNF